VHFGISRGRNTSPKEVILEKAPKQTDQGALRNEEACAMKKRDGRIIGADSAHGVEIPILKRPRGSAYIRDGAPTASHSIVVDMLEALSVRHKAGHVLLRLLPQVRIQRLTNDIRIVQVVLKAIVRKTLFEVGCRSE
jgi:hypothetical protein